jgi:hypothetical protein
MNKENYAFVVSHPELNPIIHIHSGGEDFKYEVDAACLLALATTALEGESLRQKELEDSSLKIQIMDLVKDRGLTSVSDICKASGEITGITYPSTVIALRELAEEKKLKLDGKYIDFIKD